MLRRRSERMKSAAGYASLPACGSGRTTRWNPAARLGSDAQDCKRWPLDASNAISGVIAPDQYVFPHYCTLEAMRTQGFSADFAAAASPTIPALIQPNNWKRKLLTCSRV